MRPWGYQAGCPTASPPSGWSPVSGHAAALGAATALGARPAAPASLAHDPKRLRQACFQPRSDLVRPLLHGRVVLAGGTAADPADSDLAVRRVGPGRIVHHEVLPDDRRSGCLAGRYETG